MLPTRAFYAPLCAKEAMTVLGCGYRQLLRLIESGAIAGWRHGEKGRWHFDLLELQLYIETRKRESLKVAVPAKIKKPPGRAPLGIRLVR